jgi:hypothetical protein
MMEVPVKRIHIILCGHRRLLRFRIEKAPIVSQLRWECARSTSVLDGDIRILLEKLLVAVKITLNKLMIKWIPIFKSFAVVHDPS